MSRILNGIWNLIEKIVRWCLTLVFRILKKDVNESVVEGFLQFVKFGIVGVSNTVISYVLYAGCLMIFRGLGILSGIDYIVAQIVQFVLSVLWSFYWNNKFVFELKNGDGYFMGSGLWNIRVYSTNYKFTGKRSFEFPD